MPWQLRLLQPDLGPRPGAGFGDGGPPELLLGLPSCPPAPARRNSGHPTKPKGSGFSCRGRWRWKASQRDLEDRQGRSGPEVCGIHRPCRPAATFRKSLLITDVGEINICNVLRERERPRTFSLHASPALPSANKMISIPFLLFKSTLSKKKKKKINFYRLLITLFISRKAVQNSSREEGNRIGDKHRTTNSKSGKSLSGKLSGIREQAKQTDPQPR